MIDYLRAMFAERGLAPHGYCLLWDPSLVWTHVVADAVIGLAYFSIPVVLARFIIQRRDVRFGWMVWMFAAFIIACGATHFMAIYTLWVPAYGIEGLLKAATAAVSIVTAVALWPLLPKALALPSPAQLERANTDLRNLLGERDAAIEALRRETAEREQAEAMLRQSQKMEAVGQLTSGLAHDFNNMLQVVLGNMERAAASLDRPERLTTALAAATAGAERAAKVTDQLLSFARRQRLEPQPIALNEVVVTMVPMMERAIGSGADIRYALDDDLPVVLVDRNQAENVLLNLAINARDALRGHGTVTIATAPSDMIAGGVVLSVADTGVGMSAEVQSRAFEPFFTTKTVGEGTGLGLSQVYGFTKQSGGEVVIASEEGRGTMISIHLPAAA